jgi:putative tricarboxylic transport membrane protein
MESIALLLDGFAVALRPINLALALCGVVVGTVVGMLPGIGPINAIAILLPVIFASGVAPESALILLAGVYYGSQYGNSISTILLNVPGTPSSVVTTFDGYPLTRQGRAGPALATAAVASFVGGTLSIFGLVLLAPLLASWALRFGPAEYFALMALAFAALSSLAGGSTAKALIAIGIGLLLASVGIDPNSAVPRFTFGQLRLLDGLDFVVVTIGLFAISELFVLLEASAAGRTTVAAVGRVFITARELATTAWSMVRGSVIGFLMGVLPGAGGTVATFVAYGAEQRLVDRHGTFGTGDLRGVATPEAANNAAATGALIPLLTLGVPGSATTAVMLGALMGLNVTPGPLMLERNPEIFWGLAASMYIGNAFLLALNLPLVGVFVKVLTVPRWVLVPGIAGLACVAVYAVNGATFDLFLMTAFGVAGYALRKAGIPLAPIILGLVLGPLMERNLRRALALSGGEWGVLVSSPLAIAFWTLTLLVLLLPLLGARARAAVAAQAGGQPRSVNGG